MTSLFNGSESNSRQFNDTQLMQVDYALTKLCQAYASERISRALFRYQRAALIEYVQKGNQSFPDIILNEYSQATDDDFVGEETPVVDDLGFANQLDDAAPRLHAYSHIPTHGALTLQSHETLAERVQLDAQSTKQEIEENAMKKPKINDFFTHSVKNFKISFDRYYWFYLGGFIASLFLLVLLGSV